MRKYADNNLKAKDKTIPFCFISTLCQMWLTSYL